jgi:hypothetical protein
LLAVLRQSAPQFRSLSPKAGEEVRTLDIQLGKLTLYQLSYARVNIMLIRSPQPSSFNGIAFFLPEFFVQLRVLRAFAFFFSKNRSIHTAS